MKRMTLDRTWCWQGQDLGPGADVLVPDGFPDSHRAPGSEVTSVTDAEVAEAEAAARLAIGERNEGGDIAAPYRADFTANAFLAALAAAGAPLPIKAAGETITLREALASLGVAEGGTAGESEPVAPDTLPEGGTASVPFNAAHELPMGFMTSGPIIPPPTDADETTDGAASGAGDGTASGTAPDGAEAPKAPEAPSTPPIAPRKGGKGTKGGES